MKKLIIILGFLVISCQIFAQRDLEKTLSQVVNPEELVTISENLSFDQAISILSKISEKLSGKKIVSTFTSSQPIGVQIEKLPYKKALLIIVQYNGFVFDEGEDVIVVRRKEVVEEVKSTDALYADINTREVKISCVFLRQIRLRCARWELIGLFF